VKNGMDGIRAVGSQLSLANGWSQNVSWMVSKRVIQFSGDMCRVH
jgi:hypothetical protein